MLLCNKYLEKNNNQVCEYAKNEKFIRSLLNNVHEDIKNFIFVENSKIKNEFILKHYKKNEKYDSVLSKVEPSIIYPSLPVILNENPSNVNTEDILFSYSDLTEQQKGAYLKFLHNPYKKISDIGYLYLLYCGIERYIHMYNGFHETLPVILKLREIHDDCKFQMYSGNLIMFHLLQSDNSECALNFFTSLNKPFNYKFDISLYLQCKLKYNPFFYAKDIMYFVDCFFPHSKQKTYIKNIPELFYSQLEKELIDVYGNNYIDLTKYIHENEIKKLYEAVVPVYYNTSLKTALYIKTPLLSAPKTLFRKTIQNLIKKTNIKIEKPLEEESILFSSNTNQHYNFMTKNLLLSNNEAEENLLQKYITSDNVYDKHCALILLQNFYYRHKKINEKYIEKCISYCYEDINLLPNLQNYYLENHGIYFKETIPSFSILSIIFKNKKDYINGSKICMQAIEYYSLYPFDFNKNYFETKLKYFNKQLKL